MKRKITLWLILTGILMFAFQFAQNPEKQTGHFPDEQGDSLQAEDLLSGGMNAGMSDPDSGIVILYEALRFADDGKSFSGIRFPFLKLRIHGALGRLYYLKSAYTEAEYHVKKSIVLSEYLGDKMNTRRSLGNLGAIYRSQSRFYDAVKVLSESLRLSLAANDTVQASKTMNNLGGVYVSLGYYDQALEYYARSMKLKKDINDIAGGYINIGNVYNERKDYFTARKYYNKTIEIRKKYPDDRTASITFTNLGIIYLGIFESKEKPENKPSRNYLPENTVYLDSAFQSFRNGLDLAEKVGSKHSSIFNLNGLGQVYYYKGDLGKAVDVLEKSSLLAAELGTTREEMEARKFLADSYEEMGRPAQALMNFKLYSELRDSIFNLQKNVEIGVQHSKREMEFEKYQVETEARERSRIAAAALARRNLLQNTGIAVGLLALFGVIFFIVRYSVPGWLIEMFIFVAFLFLFEFVLMFFESSVDRFAHGVPVYKLLLNALLGALIFPLHHFAERGMKSRLIKLK